jgi:hypothetical protein
MTYDRKICRTCNQTSQRLVIADCDHLFNKQKAIYKLGINHIQVYK